MIVKNPDRLIRHQSQKKLKQGAKDSMLKTSGSSTQVMQQSQSKVKLPPLNQTNGSRMSKGTQQNQSRVDSAATNHKATHAKGFKIAKPKLPVIFTEDAIPVDFVVHKSEREAREFEEDGFGVRRYVLPKHEFVGFLEEVQAIVSTDESKPQQKKVIA
jgi:hypothetical protein